MQHQSNRLLSGQLSGRDVGLDHQDAADKSHQVQSGGSGESHRRRVFALRRGRVERFRPVETLALSRQRKGLRAVGDRASIFEFVEKKTRRERSL